MSKTTFRSPLTITHIGTATALLQLDDITILTDPYFSPKGTEWTGASGAKLVSDYQPPLSLQDLPPVDLVLLSHEDHKDNLDDLGRQLLDGRRVVTTTDGARNLHPRPGVKGLQPWDTVTIRVGDGRQYTITATPCQHLPGGECIGFVISAEHFGTTDNKPNVIWLSGDTVYLPELAILKEKFHISLALLNLGKAMVPQSNGGMLQITMDGKQAIQQSRDVGADVTVPLHFEGWNHFKEKRDELTQVLREDVVNGKFKILEIGVPIKIF